MNDLTKFREGEICKVSEIRGGRMFRNKLDSLGIRPGVEIRKISTQLMSGPVIVKIGNSEMAIGFGMAKKIIVEPKDKK